MNITHEQAAREVAEGLVCSLLRAPYRTLEACDRVGLCVDHLTGAPRAVLVGALAWRDLLPHITLKPSDVAEGVSLGSRRRYFLALAVVESLERSGELRSPGARGGTWTESWVLDRVCDGVLANAWNPSRVKQMASLIVSLQSKEVVHA